MICKCGCRLLWSDGAYCQACMRVADTRMQKVYEMCTGVGLYVSLPSDVITPCPGCGKENRKQECLTCGGDPYVQPCEDCGATGHEGDEGDEG